MVWKSNYTNKILKSSSAQPEQYNQVSGVSPSGVVFLKLSFFLFFFFFLLSLDTFSGYIPSFSYLSPCTRVNQVMGASPYPISHLPEPSTTSCKAACLLFRHHLHINIARELAGKHLMWRQQFLQIFVILRPHPLSSI